MFHICPFNCTVGLLLSCKDPSQYQCTALHRPDATPVCWATETEQCNLTAVPCQERKLKAKTTLHYSFNRGNKQTEFCFSLPSFGPRIENNKTAFGFLAKYSHPETTDSHRSTLVPIGFFVCLFFLDRISCVNLTGWNSLCRSGLKFKTIHPASASSLLRLKAFTTYGAYWFLFITAIPLGCPLLVVYIQRVMQPLWLMSFIWWCCSNARWINIHAQDFGHFHYYCSRLEYSRAHWLRLRRSDRRV